METDIKTEEPEREPEGSSLRRATTGDYYINSPDLFYWMEDSGDADVPLCALGVDLPTGCRYCI